MAEQRWELYVDEPGDFSNIKDEVVVAGLLVRTEKAGIDGREIAQAVYAANSPTPTQTFQNDSRTQNVRLWAKEQALSWLP